MILYFYRQPRLQIIQYSKILSHSLNLILVLAKFISNNKGENYGTIIKFETRQEFSDL